MCIREGQEEEIIKEHEKTFVGNENVQYLACDMVT